MSDRHVPVLPAIPLSFPYKKNALALTLAAALAGCGGSGGYDLISTEIPNEVPGSEASNTPDVPVNSPPNEVRDTEIPVDALVDEVVDEEVVDEVADTALTGQFIDSAVQNLTYKTGSIVGKTNESGEFQYQPGDTIQFSIGGLMLPATPAKEIITPMDLYGVDSIDDAQVVNLARLLQALDIDDNPDNGITITETAHNIEENSGLDLTLTESFETSAITVLNSAGVDVQNLPDTGMALTHLANSLIEHQKIDRAEIESSSFLADQIAANTSPLTDTDNDKIADSFDWDDDNDGIADTIDAFPLNPAEAFDFDNDGIGNNADDDQDNDGVPNTLDQFPLVFAESFDTDGDGYGDNYDTDDDNDGVLDIFDRFPQDPDEHTDTDGDGIGNAADDDDDNDGVPDADDAFAQLASEFEDTDADGLGNNSDLDDDNDGVADRFDAFPVDPAEQFDTDGDSTGNNSDTDDDNDGVEDAIDAFPLLASEASDNDGDGLGDNLDTDDDNDSIRDQFDAFPLNALESRDSDRDGIGDNTDTDDDNDGIPDAEDQYPLDQNNSVDTDSDGFPDVIDDDNDNDGVIDVLDLYPLDSTESSDADRDGIGDNADTDDDNDGVLDIDDAFPLNPLEQSDLDGDGIGDNSDSDADNDGYEDYWDDFPADPDEWYDYDRDGIGNNADTDDDNDGIPDVDDEYPLDNQRGVDTDGDGEENRYDRDDDNDGVGDWDDAFPLDATEQLDTDDDGIGDNTDTDDDDDGVEDADDAAPLNADCSDSADAIGGECIAKLLEDITAIEFSNGTTAYMINGSSNILFRFDLLSSEWLEAVEVDNFSSEGTTLNGVHYSAQHEKLYLSFSSGVLASFDETTLDTAYLDTITFPLGSMHDAGNWLWLSHASSHEDEFRLVSDSGLAFEATGYVYDRPIDSVWSETAGRFVFIDDWGDMESMKVDQTTGAITDRVSKSVSYNESLKAPLILSPDESTILFGSGEFRSTDSLDSVGWLGHDVSHGTWTETDGLVTLTNIDEQTVLVRYSNDYAVLEVAAFDGEPRGLHFHADTYYLLTSTDSGYTTHTFTPSDDGDGDLIDNIDDAFPLDPAASLDSDFDGYPDSWNDGYSEADTDLVLDFYPNDAACHLEADGDGTTCDYSLTIPTSFPDSAVSASDGSVYLLFREENLVYRWDGSSRDYIEPLYVGSISPIGASSPDVMTYSAEHNRIYLGYDSGAVTYLELEDVTQGETSLTNMPNAINSIASAGNFIRVSSKYGYSSGEVKYLNKDGIETHIGSSYSDAAKGEFAWSASSRKLFYYTGSRMVYEYINELGVVTQTQNSDYFYNNAFEGPLVLSNDGLKVLNGSATYYDTTSLDSLGAISRKFDTGVWLDDQLVIAKATATGGELSYYDENLTPTTSESIDGTPIGLFKGDTDLILFTHTTADGVSVTVLSP